MVAHSEFGVQRPTRFQSDAISVAPAGLARPTGTILTADSRRHRVEPVRSTEFDPAAELRPPDKESDDDRQQPEPSGTDVERAFQETFAGIKPSDAVIVGIYDRYSDQAGQNAALARRFGSRS
jgi:hypothetical protein